MEEIEVLVAVVDNNDGEAKLGYNSILVALVNQSTSKSLVLQPFVVAIETKATSGNELEAKAQL